MFRKTTRLTTICQQDKRTGRLACESHETGFKSSNGFDVIRVYDVGGSEAMNGFNVPPHLASKPAASSLATAIRNGAAGATLVGLLGMAVAPAHAGWWGIPTGSSQPSPLCVDGKCASEFTARMLLFEEFGGTEDDNYDQLPATNTTPAGYKSMPSPQSMSADDPNGCWGTPKGDDIDAFLDQSLYPLPGIEASEDSTKDLPNPWQAKIQTCVGPAVTQGFMDGRPPGKWFAHQRWDEFAPKHYFQSAMAGARQNGGLRDKSQRHHYSVGEFAPGGLYNYGGTTKGIDIKIHPNLPTQSYKSVWTFDGTLPPKLLMARYGKPILFRHHNMLPIDPGANNGFGAHTISTHEHNGHNPAESDGFTAAYFYPGQFFDYHWPMILAGHDTINTAATNPRAGYPDGQGGIIKIPGDPGETMSTHWFHDHMLDYTAQNVYKGNAAMMNYYSAIDRGREPTSLAEAKSGPSGWACHYADPNNVNLCLPSGSGLDWGNRDYDVNLLVADKAWDQRGQLYFNPLNTDGFLGDRVTVNWQYKPYFEVRARRYRFRILNGAVSRYFKIALVDQNGKPVPFHMIANDGNIMEHAVKFPNSQAPESLPEQGIAERYDIIVDFKGFEGKKLYLVNLLEHKTGQTPNQAIALADVWSGKYKADGISGDPAVGKILEFRVKSLPDGQQDFSMNPAEYVEGGKKMIPRPVFPLADLQNARHRTFEFGRADGTDSKPWTIKTDGGQGYNMDPHRISAAPDLGTAEIWHLKNGGNSWSHPVHIHFEEGQILYRDGKAPPPWEKWARKDVYRLGPLQDSGSSVDVAIRFREFAGTYVEHCHNTQHEDRAMLLRWDLDHPGQQEIIPTPMSEWNGVLYDQSIELPTAHIGDTNAASNFKLP